MNYKASCPQCGTKLSRWQYFTKVLRYRCRSCGAHFRLTAVGWLITISFTALLISFFVLYRLHIISWQVAIGLILAGFAVSTWLEPYFPVRLEDRSTEEKP